MKPRVLPIIALLAANSLAADVTWNGGNYTWSQSDSDSFGSDTYQSADNVTFGNTGITDGTTGKTAITLSGTLTPGNVTFGQTGARFGGSTNSPGAVGFNYLLTSNGTANVINSTGSLNLNGGNSIFRAITTNGTYSHVFSGALNYGGGVMLGLSSGGGSQIITLSAGSLATPTAGNSVLFNAITGASANTSGNAWSATANRLIVIGSKPTVTNGMVSAGLQFYTGGNVVGDFMTFDGNNLIPATANYTSYSTDWATATSSQIVNLTAATTLTGSGDMNVHALRISSGSQNLGGRTVNLGSSGLIMTNVTISNGTLDFGNGPGFIGAYNAAGQGEITANISGSGGLTVMGSSQGLRLSNNSNSFTGGLFINGGTVVLGTSSATTAGATAANGNDVTVNDLGALTVNVTGAGGATIGGLGGNGDVAPQYQLSNSNNRAITISPASGSHTFEGHIRNGASGSVLSLIKSGSGTQIFGANSTGSHTGTTTVSAGKLVINGNFSTATGNVGVNGAGVSNRAILGGSGIIGGATSIGQYGTLAPGNSAGILTLESTLTLDAGSILAFELGALSDRIAFSTLADSLSGSGNATLQLTLLTGFSYANTYTIFQNTATSGFTLAGITGYDSVNYTASFFESGDNYLLNFTPVPEPRAALLGGLGLLMLLRRRK